MSLTAEVPHWVPRSEDDLAEAIRLGLLEEGHHLDLKREISAGRAANKELARDLASFAVDGGILLVGISEDNENGCALPGTPAACRTRRENRDGGAHDR